MEDYQERNDAISDLCLSEAELDQHLKALRREDRAAARENFIDFVDYIWEDKYVWNWHHERLCEKLQEVSEGKCRRLIVSMPPRHGKSELGKLFSAFFLGRNPDKRILACSYAADLATQINRDVQRIMVGGNYSELFPEAKLTRRNTTASDMRAKRTSNFFEIIGRTGSYFSAGVNGPITGKGANLFLIDDPVKNAAEAESPTARKKLYQWYISDAISRLEQDAAIVIIMTRWHEDDLAGKLLELAEIEEAADKWEVMNFPAICEAEDNAGDPRSIGEALWPLKYGVPYWEKIKATVGTRTWSSLYQQNPTPDAGTVILRHWFQRYSPNPELMETAVVNFYIDPAYTDKTENDPTGLLAWFVHLGNIYIVHACAVRLKFPDLIKFIGRYVEDYGYSSGSRIWIEPKASGLSILQELKASTMLNIVKDKPPKDSKITRVHGITAKLEAGRVLLPEGRLTWIQEFIEECVAFPNGKHDDRVDCLVGSVVNSFKVRSRMRGRQF